MKAMAGRTERSFETRVADLREAHAAPLAIARVPKPVVACLNGVAVGAGLSLALACDFRLAKTSTRLVAGFATLALGYMKQNLLAAETQDFAELLDREATHVARTGLSDDHREALKAFGDKRKPVFTGR